MDGPFFDIVSPMENFTFKSSQTAALLIDVQEKLFEKIDHSEALLLNLQLALRGFQILHLPLFVTEQYPQGLGSTLMSLKECFSNDQSTFPKTSFSCLGDPKIKKQILSQPAKQGILMGIEAHVCVLQSAKELLKEGKQVAVCRDAIGARSSEDLECAVAEMRDIGVRVTSIETVLF
jgi:hypothetical protein